MDVTCAVETDALTKLYPIVQRPREAFRMLLGAKPKQLVRALEDVSFQLAPGDRLGLIGLNGAGKTTLLRVLAGVLRHQGKVVVRGTKHAITEMGVGISMQLTGVEAARRLAMLYGARTKRMRQMVDDFFEYAELEAWKHRTLHTYSAGMLARLLFAILTSVPADVYLVDEFTSVGDEYFTAKSKKRFIELSQADKTLVIASHDWATLKRICNKMLWFDGGRVRMFGKSEEVIDAYLHDLMGKTYSNEERDEKSDEEADEEDKSMFDPDPSLYRKYLRIRSCRTTVADDTLTFTIVNDVLQPVKDCRIYINTLLDEEYEWCFATKSELVLGPEDGPYELRKITVTFRPVKLSAGQYRYALFITPMETEGIRRVYDKVTLMEDPDAKFVVPAGEGRRRRSVFAMPLKWIRR